MAYKMLFNTGVKPENHCALSGPNKGNLITGEHEEWVNGTLHIAYYLESKPPDGSVLQYLAPEPEQKDYLINIAIVGGGMLSKYAVFMNTRQHLT